MYYGNNIYFDAHTPLSLLTSVDPESDAGGDLCPATMVKILAH